MFIKVYVPLFTRYITYKFHRFPNCRNDDLTNEKCDLEQDLAKLQHKYSTLRNEYVSILVLIVSLIKNVCLHAKGWP